MKSYSTISPTIRLFCLILILFFVPGFLIAQHDVPREGATIDVPPFSNSVNIELKNKCDETANDITVVLWNETDGVPNILTMDIPSKTTDKVDDNYNGLLEDGEDNTGNNPADSKCRTIIDGSGIGKNAVIEINLTFSGLTNPGTKLSIHFSKEFEEEDANGEEQQQHYDMAGANEDNPIERKDNVICLSPGLKCIVLKLENKTGDPATDLSLKLTREGGDTPNIESIDIVDKDDCVDDNYDGRLGNDETENTDSSPTPYGRTILKSGTIGTSSSSRTIEVKVKLDDYTQPGTKLHVNFSKEENGLHSDMISVVPMEGPGSTALINVPVWTQQANARLINNTPEFVGMIIVNYGEVPVEQLSLEAPFENSEIFGSSPFETYIFFNPPLPPFGQASLDMFFAGPVPYSGATIQLITLESFPYECGLDVASIEVGACSPLNTYPLDIKALFNPEAKYCREYTFTNNTGQSVSDLHVIFSGSGGDLSTTVIDNPEGCPVPDIPSNGNITHMMELDWGTDCVGNGESVRVKVCTVNGPLNFEGGHWTLDNNPVEDLSADDVEEGPESGRPGQGMNFYLGDALLGVANLNGDGTASLSIADFSADPSTSTDLTIELDNGISCALSIPEAFDIPICNNEIYDLDCEQLYLHPDEVPLADYPRQQLNIGETFTIESFSNPIIDLRIIPPTTIDPSLAFICGSDYRAFSNTPSFPMEIIGMSFSRPAPYFVRVNYADGTLAEWIMEVGAYGSLGLDGESACLSGPAREIPCGEPDIAVVSSTLGFPHTWGDKGVIVTDLDSTAAAICKAFEEKGDKVSVVIQGHGSAGEVRLGSEDLNMENLEAFIEKIKDKVSDLTSVACSMAAGEAGREFVCAMEEKLGANVVAYTGSTWDTVTDPPVWYVSGEAYSWEEDITSTEIVDQSLENLIKKVYPNPSESTVFVDFIFTARQLLEVQLLGMDGKVLQSHEFFGQAGTQQLQFDLSAYPSGVYLLRFNTGRKVESKKVVKF